jgi:hypothetical protein
VGKLIQSGREPFTELSQHGENEEGVDDADDKRQCQAERPGAISLRQYRLHLGGEIDPTMTVYEVAVDKLPATSPCQRVHHAAKSQLGPSFHRYAAY